MIVDKVNAYLSGKPKHDLTIESQFSVMAGWSFTRQFMTEYEGKPGTLRLSSSGKCPRQLAYAYHGYEEKGKEKDSRSKIVFFQGDIVESMIVHLAKLAGCDIIKTGLEQAGVFLEVPGKDEPVLVEGHPDGVLIVDGKGYLVEVKSMSSFAFERFEKGEIDDGYIAQVNSYMKAMNLDACVFVAMNKDNGVLGEKIIQRDEAVIKNTIEGFSKVLCSDKEKLPDAQYTPDEKGYYPWQCRYCSFYGHCHPNAELVLVSRSYKLKEKKDGNGTGS